MRYIQTYEKFGNPNEYRKISIGNGLFTVVDAEDYDKVSKYTWSLGKNNYAVANINGKNTQMHRLIMSAPKGKVVDHIDGHRLDNRKSNLRICTQEENIMNQLKHNKNTTSKYKGVKYVKGYWYSEIKHKNRVITLGSYSHEDDAARAYNIASDLLRGPFSNKNEIPNDEERMVITKPIYKKLCDISGIAFDEEKFEGPLTKKEYDEKYKRISYPDWKKLDVIKGQRKERLVKKSLNQS